MRFSLSKIHNVRFGAVNGEAAIRTTGSKGRLSDQQAGVKSKMRFGVILTISPGDLKIACRS